MRPVRLAFSALILCLSAHPTDAEPVIKKSYSYFTVGGHTAAELEAELAEHGPQISDTGVRHSGATKIKLGGSVTYQDTGSECRVKDAVVKLETHLTLPRWTNRSRADRKTVLIWDTLSSDIKRHEERHAEIARQWARKLEKALEALRPQPDCQKMAAQVDAKTKTIIDKHAADQQRFDRVEAVSFERRMSRMLRYKVEQQHNGG
ncbi:DUF922 domain-containing Zn-dependent protease [Hoeflea sp.]|uniref:DUF922 domain-containing Zn-dependent protease n=1 Tax=Hoeflea sp. TaxID=1940281 RepID=UPI003A8C9CAE